MWREGEVSEKQLRRFEELDRSFSLKSPAPLVPLVLLDPEPLRKQVEPVPMHPNPR